MRDYFGLLQHIRAALIASGVVVGTGCGRVDPLGYMPILPPDLELELECVYASDAVTREYSGTSYTGACPDLVRVDGSESWLPEIVDGESMGVLDTGETGKVSQSNPPLCCYQWSHGFVVEGRPLIEDGRARVAAVRAQKWRAGTESAASAPDVRELAKSLRAYLARAWLRDALAEHASIASFARTTMELIAVGAPRELVRDAQAAGLDEVRHADLCFELATTYAGSPLGPGRLDSPPPRPANLIRLAVDTFFEGCVGETIAALRATRAEATCTIEPVRAILKMIIRDETKHAALSWSTVAWAISEGGAPVRAALRKAAKIERKPHAARPTPPTLRANLAAQGRLDPIAKLRAEEDAWREIINPTIADLTTDA
jgi:hypothetical protein